MKQTLAWVFPLLFLLSGVLSFNCTLKTCPANPSGSNPTPTATSTCVSYSDNYAGNTLANYDFYDGAWTPSTAAGLYWSVTGGELQETPSGGATYSFVILNNSSFPQSQGDYTVEGDFNLGAGGQGVFGVVFRANPGIYHAYIFQWNGLNGRWEIEKQKGIGIYDYVATSTSSPYVLGTSVHLKVVVSGSTFTASIDTGGGPQILFNAVTDTFNPPAPYTSGGTGIRTYNIVNGNTMHADNFSVKTPGCP